MSFFRVFIGVEPGEQEAAELCRWSILEHSTLPVQVEFLLPETLKNNSIFSKESNNNSDLSYCKFFVPYLSDYRGLAIYCSADMIWQIDIREVFRHEDSRMSLHYVRHDVPKFSNDLLLFNCSHEDCTKLTDKNINTKSLDWLVQHKWCGTNNISTLNFDYNWIVGINQAPDDGTPKILHFALEKPWGKDANLGVPYGAVWAMAKQQYKDSLIIPPAPSAFETVPAEIKQIFEAILKYRVDPECSYYDVTFEDVKMKLEKLNNNAAVAIEADTADESSDKLLNKGQDYDPFLKSFIQGSGGQISTWDKKKDSVVPAVFRGVTKRKHMEACKEASRDFYYIDTGYIGNVRKKTYHRITKNDMQYLGPVIHRPRDRLAATGVGPRKFRPGRNILLAPPSQKLLMCYGIDLDTWLQDTIDNLRLYTDREIIVRNKASRSVRQSTDTMEMALEKDVHCLVTFSSIAAVEAILCGKPAITLGPSIANCITSTSLKEIEKPYIPALDEVEEWLAHVAYCQFTEYEMRDGTAWKILNDTP